MKTIMIKKEVENNMAKAYARNKTELRKELRQIGIVPKNIKMVKNVKGYKPWFSFNISNTKTSKK